MLIKFFPINKIFVVCVFFILSTNVYGDQNLGHILGKSNEVAEENKDTEIDCYFNMFNDTCFEGNYFESSSTESSSTNSSSSSGSSRNSSSNAASSSGGVCYEILKRISRYSDNVRKTGAPGMKFKCGSGAGKVSRRGDIKYLSLDPSNNRWYRNGFLSSSGPWKNPEKAAESYCGCD